MLDDRGIDRAVLAGASMGAHTILRLALEQPERVAGLVVITPAYDPDDFDGDESLARWDALAEGLRTRRRRGLRRGLRRARACPRRWRETVLQVIRQRLAAHEHPEAVADALQRGPAVAAVRARSPTSAAIAVPTVVVADRDEADPGHPLAVGEAYAEAIPGARLVVEEEGKSPIAWQGSQLSQVIAEVRDEAAPSSDRRLRRHAAAAKLGFKPGVTVAYVNAPAHFAELLGDLPDGVTVRAGCAARSTSSSASSPRRRELERRLPAAARARSRPAGMLWIAWPKRALGRRRPT